MFSRPLPNPHAIDVSTHSLPRTVHHYDYVKPLISPTTVNGVIYHDIAVVAKPKASISVEDVLESLLDVDGRHKPSGIKRRHTTGRNEGKDKMHYRRFLSDDALEARSREICSTTWTADYYGDDNECFRDLESDDLDDIIVHCENPECNKNCVMSIARRQYLTCHNCYTYYCSRECRKNNWASHKNDCFVSRVSTMCKNIIKTANKDAHILYYLSRFARRGYLHRGRGCVVLNFINTGTAQKLLQEGLRHNNLSPMYMTIAEIDRTAIFGDVRSGLTDMCSEYNPDVKFVLYAGIGVGSQLPADIMAPPRTSDTIIEKCASLRLSPAHMLPNMEDFDDVSVVVLTVPSGSTASTVSEQRKERETGLIDIQRKLQERGVTLRYQYPEVYYKLINFISDTKSFPPQLLFPIDSRNGQKFTCIVMMESQTDVTWRPLQTGF